MFEQMTEKLWELKTNILDLMFLDWVDNHFDNQRTANDQGKQCFFGWCWVIFYCLQICWRKGNAVLHCVMHANCTVIKDFEKGRNEVAEDCQLQALILNTSAAITTELYEQTGIPRLNFQAYAYLKLNTVTVMLFIVFLHVSWRIRVRTNEPVFTQC